MALELIDGYAGEPHIDSDDLAALNVGCFGGGDYVLSGYGDALSATMSTSNQVTIGTGALMHDGRRAVNLSPQALTVQSGTQGQKRNDIVVARYEKASGTNIESMDFAVVKGTPASYGTAADPDLEDGDMALWRIPIDGITPGTPVQLFETMPPYNEFRDSVYQPVFVKAQSNAKTIAANGMETFSFTPDVPDGYVIAGFRRISTNHTGSGSITYYSSGGSSVSVSIHNYLSSSLSFTVDVEVYCVPYA